MDRNDLMAEQDDGPQLKKVHYMKDVFLEALLVLSAHCTTFSHIQCSHETRLEGLVALALRCSLDAQVESLIGEGMIVAWASHLLTPRAMIIANSCVNILL
eukprot:1729592-Amphidinium_carterae.1